MYPDESRLMVGDLKTMLSEDREIISKANKANIRQEYKMLISFQDPLNKKFGGKSVVKHKQHTDTHSRSTTAQHNSEDVVTCVYAQCIQ